MLTACLFSLFRSKEGRQPRQPLLAAGRQLPRIERVGKLLEPLRRRAFGEGIARLFEVDAFLAHPVRKPVMLIEADAGGERKIRTDAHEHPSPPPVIDVEVVLHDPSVCDLEMPSVGLAVADCGHDAGGSRALRITTTSSGFALW